MICDKHQESINLLIDGTLNMEDEVDMFKHIADCPECQAYLNVMMRIRKAIKDENIPYPDELDATVMANLAIARTPGGYSSDPGSSRHSFWKRQVRLPIGIAASLAVVVLMLGFILEYFLSTPERVKPVSTIVGEAGAQPTTVIMIYGMPPVEVLGKRMTEISNQLYHN